MQRLILGKGKVSNIIRKNDDVVLSRQQCDICDMNSLRMWISKVNPDVIINCAAKTNLEHCQEFKNDCYASNTLGVLNVVTMCHFFEKKLVHISSGCLFDGNNFISDENTPPSPAVWYTWTKKWADEIIENYGHDNYLILRPRQLISKTPHPSNMLTKFAMMDEIPAIHEANSLTCIEDFSDMIDHLLEINATGTYNCANEGTVSPYDVALGVKRYINPGLRVYSTSYARLLETLPNRRVNTILDISKLRNSGFIPRSAEDALGWCLQNYEG